MIDPVLIEQLADGAWPAAERARLGPWQVRATAGVTRRANSVFTAGYEDVDGAELVRLVEAAERFYAERGLPAVFQVSDATGAQELDRLLESRGYRTDGASEVWTAEAAGFASGPLADAVVVRAAVPSQAWFDLTFDEPAARRRVHEEIVRRVPGPRVFVSVMIHGTVAACAMAVGGAGHTGLFCMTTRQAYRRRGLGMALVGDVCAWAAGRGDGRVYLQVMRENEAAKGLYRKAGFARAYGYHYRMR